MKTGIKAFDRVSGILRYHNKGKNNGMLYASSVESQDDLLFGVAICGQPYGTKTYKSTPFISVDLDLKLNQLGYTDGKDLVLAFIDTISRLWIPPSWYILTGNGGHVFWNLSTNYKKHKYNILSLYALMSKKAVFTEYGADPTSYRLVKFSRVPGSFSTKNQVTVEGVELNNKKYNINDLLISIKGLEDVAPNTKASKHHSINKSLHNTEITYQLIDDLVSEYGRNNTLYLLLVHYRKTGMNDEDLYNKTLELHRHLSIIKTDEFTVDEAIKVYHSAKKRNITLYQNAMEGVAQYIARLKELTFVNSKTENNFNSAGQTTVYKLLEYLLLNKLANGYLRFSIAQSTLAKAAGITEKTVRYYLSRLEKYIVMVDSSYIMSKRGRFYTFTDCFLDELLYNKNNM